MSAVLDVYWFWLTYSWYGSQEHCYAYNAGGEKAGGVAGGTEGCEDRGCVVEHCVFVR